MNTKLIVPLLGVLAISSLGGCTVPNDGLIEIGPMCAPTGDCTFSATCTDSDALGALWVDLKSTSDPYTLQYVFQLNNERVNNSTTGTVGSIDTTNTNNATIENFVMTYEAPGYKLPDATSPQFMTVPAAGTTVGDVILIPQVEGEIMATILPAFPATEVIIHVRANGHFADGATFETGEYLVPVSVTNVGTYQVPCTASQTVKSACPQLGQSANVQCQ